MDVNEVIAIGRELIYLSILLSTPIVGVSLLVGLGVSIFQTLTSIQEQTLTFAPRIIAVAVAMSIALPWSLRLLVEFAASMISRIGMVTS